MLTLGFKQTHGSKRQKNAVSCQKESEFSFILLTLKCVFLYAHSVPWGKKYLASS